MPQLRYSRPDADHHAGQIAAAIERKVPDADDAIGKRDADQAGAVKERIVPMLVMLPGRVMLARPLQ